MPNEIQIATQSAVLLKDAQFNAVVLTWGYLSAGVVFLLGFTRYIAIPFLKYGLAPFMAESIILLGNIKDRIRGRHK